jgi:hypothetical protein
MGRFIFDFAYKRNAIQAVGFYLAHLVILMLLGVISVICLMVLLGKTTFSYEFAILALVLAVIYSVTITVLIINQKRLSYLYYLLAVLSGILSFFSGAILGLIIPAILVTKDNLKPTQSI